MVKKRSKKKKQKDPKKLIEEILDTKSMAALQSFCELFPKEARYERYTFMFAPSPSKGHGIIWKDVRLIDLLIIKNFWAGIIYLVGNKQVSVDETIGKVAMYYNGKVGEQVTNEYFYNYENITSKELACNFGIILPDPKFTYELYLKKVLEAKNRSPSEAV